MESIEKIRKIEQALGRLSGHEKECHLCPRECGVDRTVGEKGFCGSGKLAIVSHALLHHGEEPALSGIADCAQEEGAQEERRHGSGTIFFTGCNLKCSFCQNYQLSWLGQGKVVTDEELARMMLRLQEEGALNVNLVSPTHLLLPILRALRLALSGGLAIPLVWNSNGYEKAEILQHLQGIIDIYLPDLKYFSSLPAGKYSSAPDYFKYASRAIQEMYRQKPRLIVDEKEIAREGTIIRHLVLPGWVEDSLHILEWLHKSLATELCLSLMSQFYPCFQAPPELQRTVSADEYRTVLRRAEELEFDEVFVQPEIFSPESRLLPDFSLPEPFRWGPKTETG